MRIEDVEQRREVQEKEAESIGQEVKEHQERVSQLEISPFSSSRKRPRRWRATS